MEEKIIYNVDTPLSTLKVYEDYCVISNKKNAISLFITNKYFGGDKKFYYATHLSKFNLIF